MTGGAAPELMPLFGTVPDGHAGREAPRGSQCWVVGCKHGNK